MAIRLQNGALDLSVWSPPTRTRVMDDGETAIEKLPTQRNILALHPSGNEIPLVLHNGSGNRNPKEAGAVVRLQEKIAKGFLPLLQCPQTIGVDPKFLAPKVRGKGACHSGPAREPCPCIEETRTWRLVAQRKATEEIEKRWRSKEDAEKLERSKQLGEAQTTNRLIADLLERVVDGDVKVKSK